MQAWHNSITIIVIPIKGRAKNNNNNINSSSARSSMRFPNQHSFLLLC